MKTKHTPGEWIFVEQGDADEYAILTTENKWVIAFRQNGEMSLEKQRANAKLIAAAPVMLDALIDICKTIDCLIKQSQEGVSINESFNVPPILVESTNKCISAIKKATE